MVLNLIVAKKFTELLLFEVRCKKRDGAGAVAAAGAAGAGAGSTLYLLWIYSNLQKCVSVLISVTKMHIWVSNWPETKNFAI